MKKFNSLKYINDLITEALKSNAIAQDKKMPMRDCQHSIAQLLTYVEKLKKYLHELHYNPESHKVKNQLEIIDQMYNAAVHNIALVRRPLIEYAGTTSSQHNSQKSIEIHLSNVINHFNYCIKSMLDSHNFAQEIQSVQTIVRKSVEDVQKILSDPRPYPKVEQNLPKYLEDSSLSSDIARNSIASNQGIREMENDLVNDPSRVNSMLSSNSHQSQEGSAINAENDTGDNNSVFDLLIDKTKGVKSQSAPLKPMLPRLAVIKENAQEEKTLSLEGSYDDQMVVNYHALSHDASNILVEEQKKDEYFKHLQDYSLAAIYMLDNVDVYERVISSTVLHVQDVQEAPDKFTDIPALKAAISSVHSTSSICYVLVDFVKNDFMIYSLSHYSYMAVLNTGFSYSKNWLCHNNDNEISGICYYLDPIQATSSIALSTMLNPLSTFLSLIIGVGTRHFQVEEYANPVINLALIFSPGSNKLIKVTETMKLGFNMLDIVTKPGSSIFDKSSHYGTSSYNNTEYHYYHPSSSNDKELGDTINAEYHHYHPSNSHDKELGDTINADL
jgi:hypothetical protein